MCNKYSERGACNSDNNLPHGLTGVLGHLRLHDNESDVSADYVRDHDDLVSGEHRLVAVKPLNDLGEQGLGIERRTVVVQVDHMGLGGLDCVIVSHGVLGYRHLVLALAQRVRLRNGDGDDSRWMG